MRSNLNGSNIRGIGLIELAFFIMSSGLVLAAGAPIYHTYETHKHFDTTNNNIATVKAALDSYYQQNGRLPCPASLTAGANNAGFGVENCALPPSVGKKVTDLTTQNILTGALPVKALGLPDNVAVDGWGHLLTYSMTGDYQTKGNPGTTDLLHGVIYVRDSNAITATHVDGTAVYIVTGANPNGTGAYSIHGKPQSAACATATGLELARCLADGSSAHPFVSSTLLASQGTTALGNPIAIGGGSCVHAATPDSGTYIGNISFMVDTSGSMATDDIIADGSPPDTNCKKTPKLCVPRLSAAKTALDQVIPGVMQAKAQSGASNPTASNLVGLGTFASFDNNGSCTKKLAKKPMDGTACLYDAFDSGDVANVVNNPTKTTLPPGAYYCDPATPGCNPAKTASGQMTSSVDSMKTDGTTPLYDTMLNMANAMEYNPNNLPPDTTKPDVLVIVTDGQDTASNSNNTAMIDALTAKYPNLQVDFVYVGSPAENPFLYDSKGKPLYNANGQQLTKMESEIFTTTTKGNQLKGNFFTSQDGKDLVKKLSADITPGKNLCPQQ